MIPTILKDTLSKSYGSDFINLIEDCWKHFFKALLVSYIVIIVSFILSVILIEHPNDSYVLKYLLWSIKYFPYYYYEYASDIGIMPLYYTLQLVAFVVSLLAYSLIHKRLMFLLVLLISLSFSPFVNLCIQMSLGYFCVAPGC